MALLFAPPDRFKICRAQFSDLEVCAYRMPVECSEVPGKWEGGRALGDVRSSEQHWNSLTASKTSIDTRN